PEAIWRAQSLAMSLAMKGPPVPAHFDVVGSFRNHDRHPFVLGGDAMSGLADFRDRLRQAMRGAGFAVSFGFTPHITLLWADRCVEDDYPVAPISWLVADFVLVLSADGDHIQLGRWPLTS